MKKNRREFYGRRKENSRTKMAEGNWNTSQNRNANKIKSNMQHTEYINRVANNQEAQKNLGDENGS